MYPFTAAKGSDWLEETVKGCETGLDNGGAAATRIGSREVTSSEACILVVSLLILLDR